MTARSIRLTILEVLCPAQSLNLAPYLNTLTDRLNKSVFTWMKNYKKRHFSRRRILFWRKHTNKLKQNKFNIRVFLVSLMMF